MAKGRPATVQQRLHLGLAVLAPSSGGWLKLVQKENSVALAMCDVELMLWCTGRRLIVRPPIYLKQSECKESKSLGSVCTQKGMVFEDVPAMASTSKIESWVVEAESGRMRWVQGRCWSVPTPVRQIEAEKCDQEIVMEIESATLAEL